MKAAFLTLALAALAACAKGPEGREFRLAVPAGTPATDRALAQAPEGRPVNCVRNLTGMKVSFTVESGGKARRYELHGGEALHFRDREESLIRFPSVSEPPVRIRSRHYLVNLVPAPDCRHVFRIDTSGSIDLYGSNP